MQVNENKYFCFRMYCQPKHQQEQNNLGISTTPIELPQFRVFGFFDFFVLQVLLAAIDFLKYCCV